MSHTKYILGIFAAGIISLLGWVLVLYRLDPFSSTTIAMTLFFITLFFTLASFFTVIGYYLRVLLNRNEIYYAHIIISLRQGILFSLFVCLSLTFQLMKVLKWWNLALLFLAIILLEMFFVSRKDRGR